MERKRKKKRRDGLASNCKQATNFDKKGFGRDSRACRKGALVACTGFFFFFLFRFFFQTTQNTRPVKKQNSLAAKMLAIYPNTTPNSRSRGTSTSSACRRSSRTSRASCIQAAGRGGTTNTRSTVTSTSTRSIPPLRIRDSAICSSSSCFLFVCFLFVCSFVSSLFL